MLRSLIQALLSAAWWKRSSDVSHQAWQVASRLVVTVSVTQGPRVAAAVLARPVLDSDTADANSLAAVVNSNIDRRRSLSYVLNWLSFVI